MKILIFSQYFWPESFIINDFVRNLAEQGCEVTVATGKPNYPSGNIFKGYEAWGLQSEIFLNNIEIHRVPLWPRKQGGALNLLLNYFSFVVAGLLFFPWLLRGKKFDQIVVFAPSPIVQAIPAILLKFLKKTHLSIWVQDLWPESLSATNFIRNKFILNLVGELVRWIYSCTDTLLVQSRAFIEPVAQYASRNKIMYFPNLYDIRAMRIDKSITIPPEFKKVMVENFTFVFAGNLGSAQSLETIVKAAEQISDIEACKIVIVGSGSQSTWLQKQIDLKKLSNIYLAGRYPMDAMPEIFSYSKVLMVTLKAEPIFEYTIPSKVQAYLAAEKPILAAINGEGARIIEESGAGLVGPAEDANVLALNMRQFHAMEASEMRKLSANAKNYFDKNFDMSTHVKTFVSVMAQRSRP